MLLLILQSLGLMLTVFLVSGFVGWHLSPKPKRAQRKLSLVDETPVEVVETAPLTGLDAPFDAPARVVATEPAVEEWVYAKPVAADPMVEAAVALKSADILTFKAPATVVAEPVVADEIVPQTLDRSDRPKFSTLAAMTPESVEAAVEQAGTGLEPHRLSAPEGAADDLTIISGIGPLNQQELNDLGIYHYWQVASWTPEHVAWLSARIRFPKRIVRENWMAQAARMASRAA